VGRAHASALVAAALVALSASPAAVAHGGGAAKGYGSTVTSVSPAGSVDAVVLDGDDRLQLTVDDGRVVVITGYEGEPYLRFGPDGVFENVRSPAAYLNDDRYGKVELPDSADPDAPPEWERVAPGESFPRILIVPLVVLIVLGVGLVVLRHRRAGHEDTRS